MFRFISIWQRKQRFAKDEKKQLVLFYNHKKKIEALPHYQKQGKKILIIRLDDIGDYLLFRNTLPAYKQGGQWKNYSITLLGNAAWKELFDFLDKETTDDAIWINKKEYLQNDEYKLTIWQQLRNEGYEIVICPSATRPILLDDLCMLATGAETTIGFSNITPHIQWKKVSDILYKNQYKPNAITQEFFLNQQFAEWCCNIHLQLPKPFISIPKLAVANYMVCFIGASTKSKRWTIKRWLQLIFLLRKEHSFLIKIIGVGADKRNAISLAQKTNSESITNTSLCDVIDIINNAKAVITNDTMAAHLAVSCNVPVAIVANGGSLSARFTDYEKAGIAGVKTVYPNRFTKKRNRLGEEALKNYIASTSDIASIQANAVYKAVQTFL